MTTSFYEIWKLGQLVELTEYVIKWNVKRINQLRVFFLSLPRSDGSKTSSASHLQTKPTSLSGNVSNILSYLSNAFSNELPHLSNAFLNVSYSIFKDILRIKRNFKDILRIKSVFQNVSYLSNAFSNVSNAFADDSHFQGFVKKTETRIRN